MNENFANFSDYFKNLYLNIRHNSVDSIDFDISFIESLIGIVAKEHFKKLEIIKDAVAYNEISEEFA